MSETPHTSKVQRQKGKTRYTHIRHSELKMRCSGASEGRKIIHRMIKRDIQELDVCHDLLGKAPYVNYCREN